MAVTVRFLADVANWISGLGKSEAAVDENSDALADLLQQAIELGTEAGKSADEIAQDFSTAFGVPLDRAKRAVDEVTSSTEQLADAGKSAASAGDDIASGIEGGATKAEGSLSELGSIAQDILSGDFAGAAEGAANALDGLGVKIGVGGAVGSMVAQAVQGLVDMIVGYWEGWHEALLKAESETHAFASGIGETMDAVEFTSAVNGWTNDLEKYTQAQDIARAAGWRTKDAIDALVSGGDGLKQLASDYEEGIINTDRVTDLSAKRLSELKGTLDGVQAGFGSASAAAADNAAIMYDYALSVGTATGEVDDLGRAIFELPGGVEVAVDTTAKTATTDIQGTSAAASALDGKTATVKVNVDTRDAYRDLNYLMNLRLPTKVQTIQTNYVEKRSGTPQLGGG